MMRSLGLLALLSIGCGNLFGLVDVPHEARDAGRSDGALGDGPSGDVALGDAPVDVPLNDVLPPSACPADYGLVGGRRIKVHTTSATWTSAQQTCLNERGTSTNHTHLIVMADDLERSAIGAHAGTMTFWLGLTDRVQERVWIWVTDETSTYPGLNQAWATDEPSTNAGYNCAMQRGNDDFQATDCSSMLGFICECDAFPSDPGNY